MTIKRFNLQLPGDLSSAELASFIGLTAKAAAAKRSAIILGTTATKTKRRTWIEVEQRLEDQVLALLQTCLPGVRVELTKVAKENFTLIGDLRLSTRQRPLNADAPTAAGLLATTRSLFKGERLQWQLMLTGARTPRPIHSGKEEYSGRAFKTMLGIQDDPVISDSRDRSDLLAKQKHPLVNALGTLAVSTAASQRDQAVTGQALAALRSVEAPGVRTKLRTSWQGRRQGQLANRRLPRFEWPLQLNLDEVVALLGWPTADQVETDGDRHARWLPPATSCTRGVIVATTSNPKGNKSDLVLPDVSRGMHTHVLGPTGVGKSTVLAQAALQDIAAGRGVVVLDPKRDLVEAILQRIPKDHVNRVIVFDPSTPDRKLALNPLRGARPEQATDFLVHLMRGLFALAWGPRTEDVLRTGLLSLALTGKHTLIDLPRLLTDSQFRSSVQASLPPHPLLTEYWAWFESLSDSHRAEITAPLLSRLRSLLLAGPLHDILSIPDPRFDLDVVFRKRQVVLIPLSAGQLGADAAGLLGGLIMARLWQLTQQRSALPERMRHPVMLYLDEFHQYLHLPTSMSETLAQARGLGVGLTLAHQHLDQLTPEVRAAVLANARNRIIFQLPAKDAAVVASDMAPLVADDFKALSSYEIYLRTVNGSTVQRPASGYTVRPTPGDPKRAASIRRASLDRYGDDPRAEGRARSAGTSVSKSPPIGFKPADSDDPEVAA